MNHEQLLRTAMVQLAHDDRFRLFMEQLALRREQVTAEMCADKAVESERVSAAYIGELRAYRDIEAIYQEALQVKQDDGAEKD